MEKLRAQFLSLRHLAQGREFCGWVRWQRRPIAVVVLSSGPGPTTGRIRLSILRTGVCLMGGGNGTDPEIWDDGEIVDRLQSAYLASQTGRQS